MTKYLKKKSCLLLIFMILLAEFGSCLQVHAGTSKAKLILNHSKVTMTLGKTVQLKIKNKLGTSKKVKWSSSRPKVVSVNSKGKLKAKSVGKAKITVTQVATGRKASCQVTVKKASSGSANLPEQTQDPLSTVTSEPAQPEVSATAKDTAQYVDPSILVVSTSLITAEDGTLMTAYVINKRFSGEIHIALNGKEYSTTGSGRTLLSTLELGAVTKENHDKTLRISRQSPSDEYWLIEDLSQGVTYYLKGVRNNTLDTSVADCGVIYVVGDVQSDVKFY